MVRQESISAMEYWKDHAVEKDSLLVDVSDPADFRRLHAAGSSLVELKDTLRVARQARAANMKLYMISRRGQVAAAVSSELGRDGCDNVVTIRGGTEAWVESGLPVCRAAPVREAVFGILQLTLLLGSFVASLVYPNLHMFLVLAAAGLIVKLLAVWDDSLCEKQNRTRGPQR